MFCWDHDGVRIFRTMSVRTEGNTTVIEGTGDFSRPPGHTLFTFTAQALEQGWYVEVHRGLGKMGSYQGATFNLPLEVAAAVRRLA
jgi:hypothetical protein